MSRNRDVVWGRTTREHRSQLVDVSRAFSIEGGRWGFDPAVQRVPMGNLDPARRGRSK